jgi:hypothetical protein
MVLSMYAMSDVGIDMVMAFAGAEDGGGTQGATGGVHRRFCAGEGGTGFAASFGCNWNWSFPSFRVAGNSSSNCTRVRSPRALLEE